MKLTIDPYMFRHLSLGDMVHTVAEIGYEYIELSPREDFMPFFLHPRADRARVAELKSALRETGVQLSSLLPLYRWSGPDEDARQAAVRYWKRAIEIAVELECPVMNSEFNGRPERAAESEAQFWRSMETLLPIFEREGITLHLEAHPDDFVEQNAPAVDLVRGINSPRVRYLFCAPHTFHLGDDVAAMLRYAGPLLAHVHIADSFNHRASSGLRYIINPPGSTARIHQHLDIGQGEVPWETFFGTLREMGFDGIATACVFAWEERARQSSAFMLDQIRTRLLVAQPAGALAAARG
jgi:myo-inositol catabolism protein IolH